MIFRGWFQRRRREREARRLVKEAILSPELTRGTSLSRRHAARFMVIDHLAEGERVVRVRFTILRHPRPYSFSRQAHKVIELYDYDVEAGTIAVQKGFNVTRAEGRDAD